MIYGGAHAPCFNKSLSACLLIRPPCFVDDGSEDSPPPDFLKAPHLVRLAGSNFLLPPTETGAVTENGHAPEVSWLLFLGYQQNVVPGGIIRGN
jgi:hypothetical protein